VICIDDADRHVMLAGDATDTLEQLHALRADAIGPDPRVHVATLKTILAHCAQYPTVYLPSHDPGSGERLADATTVSQSSVSSSLPREPLVSGSSNT
jgi:N-acyl homoserine lactone hydrolase